MGKGDADMCCLGYGGKRMTIPRTLTLGGLAMAALMCHGCVDVPLVPREQYRIRAARFQIDSFLQGLYRYKADVGSFPPEARGLAGLTSDAESAGWRGPYIRNLPKDPWGHDYIYKFPGFDSEPEILSYGADGVPGGEGPNADISSRNLSADLRNSRQRGHDGILHQ